MREFDPIDKEIIRTLYVEGIPLTISEVSQKTGISWITVKKHAKHLEKKGIIDMITTKTRKTPKLALDFNILQKLIIPKPSI